MPDNTWQAYTVYGQYGALLTHFERDPNTFVGTNLLLSHRDDKRRYLVVPDLMVVFGVPDKGRPSYKVWEEGEVPDFVLEVASQGTYQKDLRSKKDTYERMGVREYCVFDPRGNMHRPRLQLFRLEGRVYKRVNWWGDPDGPLAVTSATLALELHFKDDRMRFWDPKSREYVLEQRDERAGRLEERARYEEARAQCEEARARYEEARAQCEEAHTGRIEERDRRIEAEHRARDIESEFADFKERIRRQP